MVILEKLNALEDEMTFYQMEQNKNRKRGREREIYKN